jgi:nitroreductase
MRISEWLANDAIKTASAIIVAVTEKVTFDFGLDFEVEDYAAAVENILLAATALGYASFWCDGTVRCTDAHEKIAKLLSVDEGQTVRCVLPVGVPKTLGKQASRKDFSARVIWAK